MILSGPDEVVGSSIATIARHAQVSQPTVLRFCRAVCCTGFRDFKFKLAPSRVERPWFVHEGIDETDPAPVYANKGLDSTPDVYAPSTSLVHLLIVDILAVGVALRFSRRTEARMERIKQIVRASRLQGGENLAYDA